VQPIDGTRYLQSKDTDMSQQHCKLCLEMSDDIYSTLPCCLIRILARKPKQYRQAIYELVKDRQGDQAAGELRDKVSIEFKRQVQGVVKT
jgi:hypothetical protein